MRWKYCINKANKMFAALPTDFKLLSVYIIFVIRNNSWKKQPMKFYSCRPHLPYGSSAIWNILSLEESKLCKWLHSVMSSFHSNYENQALNDWGLRETVSFVPHTLDLFPSTPERVEGQQNSLLSTGPVIKRSVLPTNSRTIAARLYFLS